MTSLKDSVMQMVTETFTKNYAAFKFEPNETWKKAVDALADGVIASLEQHMNENECSINQFVGGRISGLVRINEVLRFLRGETH